VQVTDYVPGTSYLKMIDIWCVFCIITLFAVIFAQTIIKNLMVRNRLPKMNSTVSNMNNLISLKNLKMEVFGPSNPPELTVQRIVINL